MNGSPNGSVEVSMDLEYTFVGDKEFEEKYIDDDFVETFYMTHCAFPLADKFEAEGFKFYFYGESRDENGIKTLNADIEDYGRLTVKVKSHKTRML